MTDPTVLAHPLAQHHLADLRSVETDHAAFRAGLERLGRVCGTELARDLPTERVTVETPLTETSGERLRDDVVVVAVLRAAIPFVEGILGAVPGARQGVVSASRDEHAGMNEDGTFPIAVEYANLPAVGPEDTVVVADPMLATGSTMAAVLERVLDDTTPERTIALAAVSAPAGVEHVTDRFPDVDLLTVSVDDCLDENGFIVPGLGDAGDRAFGTE